MTFSEGDFDNLSWHDNAVYSISMTDYKYQFNLEIDYISEWITHEDSKGYKFMVAPAILSFHNISDISILTVQKESTETFIDDIIRKNKRFTPNNKLEMYDYTIIMNTGEIKFTATGFNMRLIDVPKLFDKPRTNHKNSFYYLSHGINK